MNICFGLTWSGGLKLPSPLSRLRRSCVYSHNQEMARKHTWQFISKLSASSLSLKSGLRTFLFEWRHSSSFPLAHSFRITWWRTASTASRLTLELRPRAAKSIKRTFSSRSFATRFRTCGYVASACARAPTWTCSRATSGVAILAKTSQASWKRSKETRKDRNAKMKDESFEIVGNGEMWLMSEGNKN